MNQKTIRIGFDLDGVIIDKPPFMPRYLMEMLVRKKNRSLTYRFPSTNFEKRVRIISHIPLLRPPLKKNIILIKELYKSNKYELYVVSSRYSFLEKRTKEWFRFYNMGMFFKDIYINLKDKQPHLYKEEMIKKLKLNVFIDDDKPLLNYLKTKLKNIDLVYVSDQHKRFSKK